MSEQQLIAVVGATGSQGGGLVEAILADPDRRFAVRALTRDPETAAARALAARGAEVVQADLDDESSVRKAFDGAYGAFVVTNYWAERTPAEEAARSRAEMELVHAENAANAARDAGVAHVIWSTLEDTRHHFGDSDRVPTVEGRWKVPHFDAKAEANQLFADRGVPTTYLHTTFYFDALVRGLGPVRGEDGVLALTLPLGDAPLAGVASEDIGRTALGIFRRGDEFIDRTVHLAGDHLTGAEYAAALSEVLGEEVHYRPLSWDQFRQLPMPLAVEMGNMFQYYAEDSARFTGARDLDAARELNPELKSLKTWLAGHREQLKGI
jgi:uncharacterized protein YbjT (DUF2867 family)